MSLTSYRTAPSRANCVALSKSRWLGRHRKRDTFKGLTRFGGDLLSHVLRRSTIGAKALNGRVRDGTGCFALAMTTKPRKTLEIPSRTQWCVCLCPVSQSDFYWIKSSLSDN